MIDDTIRVELEVTGETESNKPDRGAVVLRRTAMNQRSGTVMESDRHLVIKREAAG